MASLLEIRNLSIEFRTTAGPLRAVEGFELKIESGEVVGIVGESGSGKSVAMLAVMGLLPWTARITADRMAFAGHDLRRMSARARRRVIGRDMAMIFQEPMSSLNPCFTVGFQLTEALRVHEGLGRAEARRRAIGLLDQVGIPAPAGRLGAFPHQLSGGMCQRVMIAMAIACNPKLLIADEPTTALDVTIQAQILDLLLGLQRERGMALTLITHDMGVIAETVDRVLVQYAGQQVEAQPVGQLFAHPMHPYTAALLAALPERAQGKHLPTIKGVVPGVTDRPSGCLFHPRCFQAQSRCRGEQPALLPHEGGLVRCHFPLHGDDPGRRGETGEDERRQPGQPDAAARAA